MLVNVMMSVGTLVFTLTGRVAVVGASVLPGVLVVYKSSQDDVSRLHVVAFPQSVGQ